MQESSIAVVVTWLYMGFYMALAESQDGGKVKLSFSTSAIIIGLDMQNAVN